MQGDQLEKAAEEVAYLIARGYRSLAASEFVAGERQLSAADRAMLAMSSRLRAHYNHHIARELDPEDVARRSLRVDTASLLGTVAAALSGRPLLRSPAGVICDPSWSRSESVDVSDAVLGAVAASVKPLRPSAVRFYLAEAEAALEPRLLKYGGALNFEIKRVADVAAALSGSSRVCTSDPELLDQCVNWFNLAGRVVEGTDARVVSLDF